MAAWDDAAAAPVRTGRSGLCAVSRCRTRSARRIVSCLYYTDSGQVVTGHSEELSRFRRARKVLELPGTREAARLYLLARCYPENRLPLWIAVNGREQRALEPRLEGRYAWHEVELARGELGSGTNVVELWTEAPAMDAWSLALAACPGRAGSFLSTDGGASWRADRLGCHNQMVGEYVARVRLAEGNDPPPPAMIWEDPCVPRLAQLRTRLPVMPPGPTYARVRALAAWVSQAWEYRNANYGEVYAPWDAETILAWGKAGHGHGGARPIVMCVHYAVTFISCCMALGMAARPAVFTGGINEFSGHFTAEVWFPEWNKWALVDPNMDALFVRDGVPLAVEEIQDASDRLADLVEWGPGYEFQQENAVIRDWTNSVYLRGEWIRQRGVWPRTDFLTHPEETPASHGVIAYSEANLVWQAAAREAGFGMFPYFGDEEYFAAAPGAFLQQVEEAHAQSKLDARPELA